MSDELVNGPASERRRALEVMNRNATVVIAVINSGFFLWILSAVAIALGGSYFTTEATCQKEAEPLAYEAHNVQLELSMRSRNYAKAILKSENFDQFKNEVAKYGASVSELKDKTDGDLHNRLSYILRRATPGVTPHPGIVSMIYDAWWPRALFRKIDDGKDITLEDMKAARSELFRALPDLKEFGISRFQYRKILFLPNCTMAEIIKQMRNKSRQILIQSELIEFEEPYGTFVPVEDGSEKRDMPPRPKSVWQN